MATIPTLSSDATAQSTPSSTTSSLINATKPLEECTSLLCPINNPHDRGLYLHSCRLPLNSESSLIFAPSIPPPDVLAAYERCVRDEGTKADEEMWMMFYELHVEPLLEYIDAAWVMPVPVRSPSDDLELDKCAGSDGVEADGGSEGYRHPFGLRSPPEIVWQAHGRLVDGVGDLGDQELVDIFAEKNAYDGNGVGQYTRSRRFQIRRPHYSAKLAKQRRIKRKWESKRSRV